jgi:hypothetical protein
VAAGIQAPALQGVGSARLDRFPAVRGPAQRHTEAETGRGGLDWRDAAVGSAIFVGVVLMGLWGYVVVGAVIAGAAALLGAGAKLATGSPRGGHAWSDWPAPVVARVEKQQGRRRRLFRGPEKNLASLLAHLERAKDPELH